MIVTLLTDFGTADYFVAAMKGVILERDPRIRVVDVSHEVPPQDVQAGAFTLLAAYGAFPERTVHLAVVDPGVGSARRPLVAEAGGHLFVGPDNGILSHVAAREPDARVHHLADESIFRQPVSATFHGRDVFAPAAAALALGVAPAALGPRVDDFVRLDAITTAREGEKTVIGRILHIDRFGNCVTTLTPADLPPEALARGMRITVGAHEILSVRRFYSESAAESGDPFAIWGSAGFLELSLNGGSAADRLGAERGDAVRVTLG